MVNDTSNRLFTAKEELQRVIEAEDLESQFKVNLEQMTSGFSNGFVDFSNDDLI